jgi:hypothetical protein
MDTDTWLTLLADCLLIVHFAFILFVLLGWLLILIGKFRAWVWVRNRTFRVVHLIAITYVALQAWFGKVCPLTMLEMHLRAQAGQFGYDGSFIAFWLHELIYFSAPSWVFILAYTLFCFAVLLSWWWVKPATST